MKACMCVIYVPIGEKRFVCKRTEEEKKNYIDTIHCDEGYKHIHAIILYRRNMNNFGICFENVSIIRDMIEC